MMLQITVHWGFHSHLNKRLTPTHIPPEEYDDGAAPLYAKRELYGATPPHPTQTNPLSNCAAACQSHDALCSKAMSQSVLQRVRK